MTLLLLVIVLTVVALSWAALRRETYIELTDEEDKPQRKQRSDKGKKRGNYK